MTKLKPTVLRANNNFLTSAGQTIQFIVYWSVSLLMIHDHCEHVKGRRLVPTALP